MIIPILASSVVSISDLKKNPSAVIEAAEGFPVAMGDRYRDFADHKVREGRYGSTSEVIRAGLRLLEAEEQKLEALRAAIREGFDSGPAEAFDIRGWIDEKYPV